MRIRNRKVPFPLSSLSPVPLSDPPFSGLLQRSSAPHRSFSPQDAKSSLQPNKYSGGRSSSLNSSDCTSNQAETKFSCKEGRAQDDYPNGGEEEEGQMIGTHKRNETTSAAITPISSLHQVLLPKKRRGDIEMRKTNGETEDKKMKSKEITKKKRERGGEIMEGSRCSRVNGRGWRCCQPTLVGYSLCEHHLGKGRLRSITTQPTTLNKRKHNLGMVKARSMTTLLGQPNHAVVRIGGNEG